jgi:hypothetical protein
MTAENIYGMTYENSRKKAENLMNKINDEKAEQLFRSSKFPYSK